MAGKRIIYKNDRTKHITWLHPQLHSKPVLPLLVSLATYTSGAFVSLVPGTAESLLQQRAAQIMKIQPPHAPPSGSFENIIDAQSAFNSLFVNILKLYNPKAPVAAAAAAPQLGFGGGSAPSFGGGAAASPVFNTAGSMTAPVISKKSRSFR